jgi:hypothetical protein
MAEAIHADGSASATHAAHDDHSTELRKEAFTMALYVAICLLAALAAVSERTVADHSNGLMIIWGTTVGLALAHWLAFRVSSRLVAAGTIRRHDVEAAGAQMGAAAVVALLATIPLLLSSTVEFDVVRLVLAGFIAVVGYGAARAGGATPTRSAVYGVTVLVVALGVAIVKNALAGH